MAAPASDCLRHFRPLLWNRWTGCPGLWLALDISDFSETTVWNITKLDRKEDLNALFQVCIFQADKKNKTVALVSDWLRYFRLLLWNHWTEFNQNWQEQDFNILHQVFFGVDKKKIKKQDGSQVLWLTETFLTSPLKPLTESNETW